MGVLRVWPDWARPQFSTWKGKACLKLKDFLIYVWLLIFFRHDKLPADQIILNIFGLSVVVYGTIVVFLTTKSDFTREETDAVPN